MIEYYLVGGAVLLILSVAASKISDKYGVPALLIFLLIGMLAGSEGIGGIYFDDPFLAQTLGTIALIVILFSGGLDSTWIHFREVLPAGITLATFGVVATALILGFFAHLIMDLSLYEGFLLGAIVSSTDAAAVFAILRSKGVYLPGKLKQLLELESGSNDPMAVLLTITFARLIQNPDLSLVSQIPALIMQMGFGLLTGIVIGKFALFAINKMKLGYSGLYPVLTVGIILFAYGITNIIGGSGFLAVYITGLTMSRSDFLHKKSMVRFYDGLAWLMQITMFLMLGLLVFPSRMIAYWLPALGIAMILIIFARPLAVWLLLLPTKFTSSERSFISWVGLRGAVPIILAIYPRIMGLPNSDLYFNVIFFVVMTSVLIQGTSIPKMAKLLKVSVEPDEITNYPIEPVSGKEWQGQLQEIPIRSDSWVVGKAIYEIKLPQEYLVVLISRGKDFVIPNGSVVLQAGDKVLGLSIGDVHQRVKACFESVAPKYPGE